MKGGGASQAVDARRDAEEAPAREHDEAPETEAHAASGDAPVAERPTDAPAPSAAPATANSIAASAADAGTVEPHAPSAWRVALMRFVLLIVIPAALIAGGVLYWLWGGRYVTTSNAYVKSDIARISAGVIGRIAAVHVRDHQRIKVGDRLITLDPKPFELALARARAEVDATRQQVATLIARWQEARAALKEAQTQEAFFTKQMKRQRRLTRRGVVSSARFEEIENRAASARDRIVVMRQRLARVRAQLGQRPARLKIDSHPMVREKLAALQTAQFNLSQTKITSPIAGIAVNVRVQPGEQIRDVGTPLFAIVKAGDAWVEANFKETELTHVIAGQRATITLDIYPDVTFEAQVASISPATGAEFAILPPQNASGNWVKVVQRLPVRLRIMPREGQPVLRAGMTASVSIDTQRERTLSQLWRGLLPSSAASATPSATAVPASPEAPPAASAKPK